MTEQDGHGSRLRLWPWFVLALATLPSIWYVLDFEEDIDPEFPRVVRPTFSTYPPPAYRFAEPGDTIDHVAVYVSSAALVVSGWGLLRGPHRRVWLAALAISAAGYWHAVTPGRLLDGWHGLGWRVICDPSAPFLLRGSLAGAAIGLAIVIIWGLSGRPMRDQWIGARLHGVAALLIV